MVNSERQVVFIVAPVSLGISLLVVSLRYLVRLSLVKAFGWDDVLMGLATIFNLALTICLLVGAASGIGEKLVYFENRPESYQKALLTSWLSMIFYIIACMLAKISITASLRRFATKRLYIHILDAIAALSVLVSLFTFFLTIFQCHQVSYFWNRPEGEGICHTDLFIGTIYSYSILSAATDLALGIIPGFLIWKLQSTILRKVALTIVLGLGCITAFAVIVRIPFIHFYRSKDFLYATSKITIFSMIEAGLGITAGSLATLRPLIAIFHGRLSAFKDPVRAINLYSMSRNEPADSRGHASALRKDNGLDGDSTKLLILNDADDYHNVITSL